MKIIDAHSHIGNFGSWARFDFDIVRLKEQMCEFNIEKTLRAALERRSIAGRVLMPDDGEEYSFN